jgi:N-acetylmuramoyl-L-alanine amidase
MTSHWRELCRRTSICPDLLSSEGIATGDGNICRPSVTWVLFLPYAARRGGLGCDLPSLRDCLIGAVVGRARGLKSTRRIENRTLSGTAKAVPLQSAAKRGSAIRFAGILLVWLAVCGTSFGVQSGSPAVRKQQARTQFETAERMREALNGRPESERTRRDYQKVAEAYRKVYYVSPASSKADASVVAVAEILAEMGRQFSPDEKDLHAAIGQYEFLRHEYPGSKYRVEALFTIGQIYKEDLGDEAEARATFEEFLKHYPRNQLVPKAQEALVEINQPKAKKKPQMAARTDAEAATTDARTVAAKKTALPRVTGIRHWSTADYTRVAIDLDAEVKYQAGRVPDPDRIFFDLPDTRLASTLVGKSFDVQDGFLKKIRVAQYQLGSTRVVLEVDDVAEYSAFLLPNPYRLIIDIHGREPHSQSQVAANPPSGVAADEYVAKATPPAAASNATSPNSITKSGKGQAGVATRVTPSDSAATPKQEVSTSSAAVRVQPRASSAAGDPAATSSSDAPAAATAASSRSAAAKASTTIASKTPNSAAPAPSSEAPGKSSQTAASKASPNSAVTVAHANTNNVDDDEDLPSPGGAGGKTNAKPTAAPTAVTVSPDKDKKPRGNKKVTAASATEAPAVHEASPTADGDRSLIRALGLKIGRIVIDAGHGGHDTGTIGPNGLLEKDLVLDVALRLGRLLEARLGAEVIYTRDDDTFIPLETRTAIANEHQADLFISVHANSSQDESARGVETYYLNFTSNPEALEVAARENAVSEKSIHELQDLVKKITLKEKIEESRELASDVQLSLYTGLSAKSPTLRNRGVKKAPFVVLIGANMPSILAEISFVSNPVDEKKLETSEYRQKIAESLYKGIAKYAGGLSGMKVAAKFNKDAGQ